LFLLQYSIQTNKIQKMNALSQILGKDIVTLIYHKLHTMQMSLLIIEYKGRVHIENDVMHGIYIYWFPEIYVRYNWRCYDRTYFKTPIYNKKGSSHFPIYNKKDSYFPSRDI
jgi:hypothetical protein